MIKLQRGEKPAYLTDDKVKELTEKFNANTSKVVWKHDDIHNALINSSASKCAYCECELQIEDSYMQIEHFKDKGSYPDNVVDWENLLPSCARCNRKKWTLDVEKFPIVNPYVDEPKEHLHLEAFALYGKGEKGDNTVKKLDLNDEKILLPRFKLCDEIRRKLSNIKILLIDIDEARNNLVNLLQSCQCDKAYSAYVSTTLHRNMDYEEIKLKLKEAGLWDVELERLHQNSLNLVLDRRKEKAR